MFNTTQDIFYLVLSFCVLWFTVFLCWFLYYLIKTIKQANEIVVDVREQLAKITGLLGLLKSKMVAEGIKTTKSVYDLAVKEKIDLPLTTQVYKVLYEKKELKKAIKDLITLI